MKTKDLITLREVLFNAYTVALDQLDKDVLIFADKSHWVVVESRNNIAKILKSIRIIEKL